MRSMIEALRETLKGRGAAALAVAAVVLVLAGCAAQGADSAREEGTALPETGSSANAERAQAILAFTLEAPDWVAAEDGSIVVKISGQTDEGKQVSMTISEAEAKGYGPCSKCY